MRFTSQGNIPHRPWLTYAVTRSYPYKWFTPLVFIGGLLATILFSILNFAGNAYQMETVITTDPNNTIRQYEWLSRPPWSWTNKVEATCQVESIPVGTKIITDKYGLTYTLTAVVSNRDPSRLSPALPYLNNDIGACDFKEMNIRFPRSDGIGIESRKIFSTLDSTNAEAVMICNVTSQDGILSAKLVFSFANHIEDGNGLVKLPLRSEKDSLDIDYGSILVTAYWHLMTSRMAHSTPWNDPSGPKYDASFMTIWLDRKGSFMNHSKFAFLYGWEQSDGVMLKSFSPDVFGKGPYKDTERHNLGSLYNTGPRLVKQGNKPSTRFPDIINETEGFASSLFSLIMADLGQKERTIFQNATLLRRYLQAADNHHQESRKFMKTEPFYVRNMGWRSAYNLSNHVNQSSLADPVPSRIYYQYSCSVPVAKGAFQMIVAIAIADFVMLSVLWQILDWILIRCVMRKDPQANYCDGCVTSSESSGNPQNPVTSTTARTFHDSALSEADPILHEENLAAAYRWTDSEMASDNGAGTSMQTRPKGKRIKHGVFRSRQGQN